ncbi:hypothetical protein BDQ17DRAFT_1379496 [Cyathus striatus]|nr:hypothetical protein BDQ17DRAFT_1379496 [Cyathus striatus]
MKAVLDGHTLAESTETKVVEGNHYFPPSSIDNDLFADSGTQYNCPWKGDAAYHNAVIDGKTTKDVAWSYPHTITDRAKPIEGYYAFDKSKVTVE